MTNQPFRVNFVRTDGSITTVYEARIAKLTAQDWTDFLYWKGAKIAKICYQGGSVFVLMTGATKFGSAK